MAFTYTGSENLLKGMTGKSQNGLLSNCYIALSTTEPSPDGTNFTEPSSVNGYARSIIGLWQQSSTQVMGNPVNGSITNADIIFFPEATASWGTITHFGLFNQATGGQMMVYGALTTPITVGANYVPLFRVGNFTLTLT